MKRGKGQRDGWGGQIWSRDGGGIGDASAADIVNLFPGLILWFKVDLQEQNCCGRSD